MRPGTDGGAEVESVKGTVDTVLGTVATGGGEKKDDPDETMGFSLGAATQGHLVGVSVSVIPKNMGFALK